MMVEILMATYNGERYLSEQIESILNQSYKDWKLLVRDDGSKDRTLDILKLYKAKYPKKITLMEDKKGGLRAKENFLELLRQSKSDYIMFCDQDDVWLPNKIEVTLEKMKKVENGPTLIHTDLKVVDKELNLISDSMWRYQKLSPERKEYNFLIVQNNITGCTMMINRELAKLSIGEFPNGLMHDWIIGIVASLKGTIDYVEERTILYRQHGNNDVGAQEYYANFLKKIKKVNELKKKIYLTNYQLKDILINIVIEDSILKNKLEEYIGLPQKNFFYRKKWIIKNKFLKQGVLWKIGYVVLY